MTTVAVVNPRASVPAVLVDDMDDQPPGAFEWYTSSTVGPDAGILWMCPCGCGSMWAAAVKAHPGAGPVWTWNGNREKPTLTPSLLVYQMNDKGERIGEHWHGFLTDGEFRSC